MSAKFRRRILPLALAFGGARLAQATAYVGIPMGLGLGHSIVPGYGYGPRYIVGLEAGSRFDENFGVGAFFDWSQKDGMSFIPFGVEANYYFAHIGGYAGLNVGIAHTSIAAGGFYPTPSDNNFFVGAQAGYESMAADYTALGAKIVYDLYDNLAIDSVGTRRPLNAFKLLATLRFWF